MWAKKQEKKTKLGGCRPEKAKNDTEEVVPWPLEDSIRWMEWRIRELTIENGKYMEEQGKWLLEEKSAGGRVLKLQGELADYAVWLLKVRDGLSWHQIAYRFFPGATEEEIETFESRVRRAYNRVERNHPGSKRFRPIPLSKDEKLLLVAATHGAVIFPPGPRQVR